MFTCLRFSNMLKNAFSIILVLKVLTISSSSQDCEDVNTDVCHLMAAKDPSLCSNSCLLPLCKRFCGTCPPRIECYQCNEVKNPNDCNTTVTCANQDEICVVSEYTDWLSNVLYRMGCAPKQICVDHFNYNLTSGMTDINSSDDLVSGACCSTNLCNNQTHRVLINVNSTGLLLHRSVRNLNIRELPTGNPRSLYSRSESECSDMGTSICSLLSQTLPDMCQNQCITAVVCPRTCRRCLSCHSCEHASRPSGCNHTKICEGGQLCFSLKTISMMLEHGYRLGCMDKYICDSFHKEAPMAFGRRGRQTIELSLNGGCCSTDLCNNREMNGVVMTLPVSTQSITSTMTTPSVSRTSATTRCSV